MADSYDYIVVGNGAIGCAVAFELQQREAGAKIALVGQANRPGSASAAAGAMLNVYAELDAGTLEHPIHRHKFELARRATAKWPNWIAALRSAAPGASCPEIVLGTYILKNMVGDEQDDDAYRAIKAALIEYQEPFEIVEPSAIKGYLPSVQGRAFEAIYIPGEGLINPRQLFATYQSVFEAGSPVRTVDATAVRLTVGAAGQKTVHLADGAQLSAPKVLLAAGAETRTLIASIPEIKDRVLPLFYGVGAALLLKIRGEAPPKVIRTPNRALACGIHMVPQSENTVYIGASNQISPWPEFAPRLTSVQFLAESAMDQLNSSYYNAELQHTFLGYRPTSADTLPMIGETSVPGLFMLTGTKRDGLHNSPIFAEDMVDRMLGGTGFIDKALAPERKVIPWLSKAEGINLGVRHLRSAGIQHGLRMPRSNWTPMVDDMLTQHVEEVYRVSGVEYGIPPELLDIYRHGHITKDH